MLRELVPICLISSAVVPPLGLPLQPGSWSNDSLDRNPQRTHSAVV